MILVLKHETVPFERHESRSGRELSRGKVQLKLGTVKKKEVKERLQQPLKKFGLGGNGKEPGIPASGAQKNLTRSHFENDTSGQRKQEERGFEEQGKTKENRQKQNEKLKPKGKKHQWVGGRLGAIGPVLKEKRQQGRIRRKNCHYDQKKT